MEEIDAVADGSDVNDRSCGEEGTDFSVEADGSAVDQPTEKENPGRVPERADRQVVPGKSCKAFEEDRSCQAAGAQEASEAIKGNWHHLRFPLQEREEASETECIEAGKGQNFRERVIRPEECCSDPESRSKEDQNNQCIPQRSER